jgi:hypothetical protein
MKIMKDLQEAVVSEAKVHEFNLFVNGTREDWSGELISFDQVVRLAYPSDPNPNTIYAVTYNHGPKENREGSLVQSDPPVKVKSGMRFYVTPTGQS